MNVSLEVIGQCNLGPGVIFHKKIKNSANNQRVMFTNNINLASQSHLWPYAIFTLFMEN